MVVGCGIRCDHKCGGMMQDVELVVCGAMCKTWCYVVVRCINDVASIWCDLNVAWSTWNVALCCTSLMSNGVQCEMWCDACGRYGAI